jgi:hypothetical protein
LIKRGGKNGRGLDALPSALLRHTAIGVRLWRTGQLYVTVDWPAPVEEPA